MWIELHDTARDHPKMRKLARELGISRVQALGHMVSLWTWALRMAPDGDLSSFDDEDIEVDGAEWTDESVSFVEAARKVKLLDGKNIHDWEDYAGSLKAAQRAKISREKKNSQEGSAHACARVRDSAHACEEFADRPDQTDQTRPDRPDRQRAHASFNFSFFNNSENSVFSISELESELEGWLGEIPGRSPKPNEPAPRERLAKLEPLERTEIGKAVEKTKKAQRPSWNYLIRVLERDRQKTDEFLDPLRAPGMPPFFRREEHTTGPPPNDEMKALIKQLGEKLGVHRRD